MKLEMENKERKPIREVAGMMLERACCECSCEHRVAIDMSKAGKFDPCMFCKMYRKVYPVVR